MDRNLAVIGRSRFAGELGSRPAFRCSTLPPGNAADVLSPMPRDFAVGC